MLSPFVRGAYMAQLRRCLAKSGEKTQTLRAAITLSPFVPGAHGAVTGMHWPNGVLQFEPARPRGRYAARAAC